MRIQKNRFRRIAWSIESYVGIVRNILHFEYPLQSYSFYLMLLSLILFVDANMALHYFIVLLILLMAYCHPSMQIWIKEIITLTHLNDSIKRFWSVWTAKGEPSEAKVRLRKDV